jgi:predicted DNA-binding protein
MTHEEDVAAYAASMGWEEVEPDKDVPTEEDMLRWTTLSQKFDRESPKKRALRGAICDYIDEMEVYEFTEDLISILIKEEIYFRNRADIYANFIALVEQLSEKLGSSKDAE